MGLTVEKNLRLGPGSIEVALDLLELRPLLARKAGMLSGGEQQILGLARAFVTPRLLLVDELSLGLAPKVVQRLLGAVSVAARVSASSSSSSTRGKALAVADRGYVMSRGRSPAVRNRRRAARSNRRHRAHLLARPGRALYDMNDMELSCGLPPGPDFAELAWLAEELGYARVDLRLRAVLEDCFVHLALAATRTTRIGLSTAVLIPTQRSVMTTASALVMICRLSGGRLRAAFGTGFTARFALGQRPMKLDALVEYVRALRGLLVERRSLSTGARRGRCTTRAGRAAAHRRHDARASRTTVHSRRWSRGRAHRSPPPAAALRRDGVRHRARTRRTT